MDIFTYMYEKDYAYDRIMKKSFYQPFIFTLSCTSLSSSSLINCAFDKSKSKSVSNLRVAEGTLATISWPLLRFLRLRAPKIHFFLKKKANASNVSRPFFPPPRFSFFYKSVYNYLVFSWVVACFHYSAAEFPAEHWAYLVLTSLKFKKTFTPTFNIAHSCTDGHVEFPEA